jgi:uncharacterized protein DUF1844
VSEADDKPIRVVDRRMFTPEGELRPDFEPEEPAPEPLRAAAHAETTNQPPRGIPVPEATEPGPSSESESPGAAPGESVSEFARIVSSLATTAYSALGLISDPVAGAGHRDLAVARQMIDWLAVLEQKTRGNLSFEESDLLSRVLYELRLAYVEVGRAPR